MRRFAFRVATLTLAAVLGGRGAAQSWPPLPAPPTPARTGTPCTLETHGDALRGRGPDYQATFTREGVTFRPGLGRAPREFHLRLRTTSWQRETGDAIAAVAAPPRAAAEGERTVCYARGAGVVERWRVVPEGIELSYTLAGPLPGAGNLVVRLELTTDLVTLAAPPGSAATDGLRLHAPSSDSVPLGGVRVGGVTGIDANGRRSAGNLALVGSTLELRLPAAFVDSAQYPLLLDPLIGTDFAVNAVSDQRRPDAAYDAASRRYLVAWQQEIDPGNSQIAAHMVDAQGNPIGPALLIAYSPGAHALAPAVANVRGSGRFLVAWLEGPSLLGPWHIACRCVNPDGALSPILTGLGDVSATELFGPVLGGNASPSDTGALLAYATSTSLLARRITVPAGSAAPTAGAVFTVSTMPALVQEPAITESTGAGGRWVVMWRSTVFGMPPVTLRARAISSAGSLLGSELDFGQPPGAWHALDGDGATFLLAYVANGDVHGQKLVWTGTDLAVSGGPAQITSSGTGKRDLRVGLLGPKVLLAWTDDGGIALNSEIRGVAIDPEDCRTCDVPFTIARSRTYVLAPAIAPQFAASPAAGDEGLIVFAAGALAPPFEGTIRAQRFAAFGSTGTLTSVGGGCGRPFPMSAVGPIAVGNRRLALELGGVTGAAAVFTSIGIPGAAPLPCGGCQVTVPVLALAARFANNTALTSLGLRCDLAVVGVQLEVQGWVLMPGLSPCPLVADLAFSDRHLLTIGL
jgi:hypothetical protein